MVGTLGGAAAGQSYILNVDRVNRRLYVGYNRNDASGFNSYVGEYDLRTDVPTLLREVKLGSFQDAGGTSSPYKSALDPSRRRLFMLRTIVGHPGTEIRRIDTKNLKGEEPWDLNHQLPGFVASGMTYSKRDDRIYLVGMIEGAYRATRAGPETFGYNPAEAGLVVALDAVTGDVQWIRSVPQCRRVLDSFATGALLGASVQRQALYFFCTSGGVGGVVPSANYPGQPGLVRLTISSEAGMAQAARFPVEFFPVSGAHFRFPLASGIAGFDPGGDRVFVQSLAEKTPGGWVFDGKLSAWVGFVAAPDPSNEYLGVDPESGHYYMAGGDEEPYLIVTDGRDTPVPQGTVHGVPVDSFITTDPQTRRLFFRTAGGIAVVKDHVKDSPPLQPTDYDSLTSNVAESANSTTSFSASVNGFGARAHLVGGATGLYSFLHEPPEHERLRTSERAITTARVPSLDLRDVGASATAHANVADPLTTPELEGNVNEVRRSAQLEGNTEEFVWPWQPAVCLDGGGQPASMSAPPAQGASADVTCDLGKQTATAHSSMDGLAAGAVKVEGAEMRTKALRLPDDGAITESVSRAYGVEISIPQVGSLSIAEVSASVRSAAHGRPGTANVVWERRLDGIVIRDAAGQVVNSLPACKSTSGEDNCDEIATAIRETLGTKVRVEFPTPDLIATPKGAFAGIQQTDSDFYQGRTVFNQGAAFDGESESRAVPAMQLVVFNDSSEKSRLLMQLAAIQASSLYTIAPAAEFDTFDPAPVDPAPASTTDAGSSTMSAPAPTVDVADSGDLGTGGSAGFEQPIAPTDDLVIETASAPQEGFVYLLRSRNQAVLFALMLAMCLGAAGVVVKRQLLLKVLSARGRS